MKWPWQKIQTDTGGAEARRRAEESLARARAETPYYERLGADSKRIREENHWSGTIARIAKNGAR